MHTAGATLLGLVLDDRYLVTSKLGEGGMGAVYRATDRRLDTEVVYQLTATLRGDTPVGRWYTDVWLKTNVSSMEQLRVPLTVEIVKRPQNQHTFEVLPRRWVAGRTLAWITSYRRCARDYERLPAHHEAAVYWAMISVMTRRLARHG